MMLEFFNFISFAKGIADNIIDPIIDLNNKIKLMRNQKDMNIVLDEKYKNASIEIKTLYESFDNLTTTIRFTNNAFNAGSDARALLNFAEAYQLFSGVNNLKAMGICLNNMGNIHYRNKRYNEACIDYKESIRLAKKLMQ
jgi:hypothetical protein